MSVCRVSAVRRRCRPLRLARMNRFGTGVVGKRESVRVWSHRGAGRGVRYIHHDVNGRSVRANVRRRALGFDPGWAR